MKRAALLLCTVTLAAQQQQPASPQIGFIYTRATPSAEEGLPSGGRIQELL